MSNDNKTLLMQGYRVKHTYKRRRHCYDRCIRCGVQRRKVNGNWEWRATPVVAEWQRVNPRCTKREQY